MISDGLPAAIPLPDRRAEHHHDFSATSTSWAAEGGSLCMDDVRREPTLLRAIKRAIDRDRAAGRFLADRVEICCWRTVTGDEVDFVIEAGGRLLPVEVKPTSRPRLDDAAGLRTFRAEYGKSARAGLLLHAGQTLEWLAPDILAAPRWSVP